MSQVVIAALWLCQRVVVPRCRDLDADISIGNPKRGYAEHILGKIFLTAGPSYDELSGGSSLQGSTQ